MEEGLCDGAVLFHAHEKRTPEQAREQQRRVDDREKLRNERRRQQEVRVLGGSVCGGGGCRRPPAVLAPLGVHHGLCTCVRVCDCVPVSVLVRV